MMDDDEPMAAGPIMSAHEVALPPVSRPPVEKLPEGEPMSLAGEVVSWVRERAVEAWWAAQAEVKAEAKGADAPVNGDAQVGKEEQIAVDAATEQTNSTGGEDGQIVDIEPAPSAKVEKPSARPMPKFNSSGTVVVRAMQARPGQEGWLEQGSVVCLPDGRVLGCVSVL
jgi:H/ACA ribonucleoprotein complex non-core subunit NAF1